MHFLKLLGQAWVTGIPLNLGNMYNTSDGVIYRALIIYDYLLRSADALS